MNRGKLRCAARGITLLVSKCLTMQDFLSAAWACLDSFGSALRAETTSPIHSDARPTLGLSFLCSEPSRTVKTLRYRSGEKPMPLPWQHRHVLPHSIPQPPQPARLALCFVPACLLLKNPLLLLSELSLTEFDGMRIREARQIEAKSHHLDHSIAIHMN